MGFDPGIQGCFRVKSADGRWVLDWEDIGEGYDGDFTDDPDDRPLWRATLVDENDEQLSDGSYCTSAVVGEASKRELTLMAEDLFRSLGSSPFNRRVMQEWTWRTRKES
jgi:hypothetical protein